MSFWLYKKDTQELAVQFFQLLFYHGRIRFHQACNVQMPNPGNCIHLLYEWVKPVDIQASVLLIVSKQIHLTS